VINDHRRTINLLEISINRHQRPINDLANRSEARAISINPCANSLNRFAAQPNTIATLVNKPHPQFFATERAANVHSQRFFRRPPGINDLAP
jgi:hypothetical protein